jgi:tetraacyldisaccharide-1-P 4'-kinase
VLPGIYQVVRHPLQFPRIEEPYALLSAIGDPGRFRQEVLDSGLVPGPPDYEIRRRDHADLATGTLLDGVPESMPILTTHKDWVKLRQRSDLRNRRIEVAMLKVEIQPGEPFLDWLLENLNA